MPEELLLLVEEVEEGAQVLRFRTSIPNHRSCTRVPHPLACSQATWPTAGHHGGLRCSWTTSNAPQITIPSHSVSAELTPTALTAPGSLPISFLSARLNFPKNPAIPYNRFATAEESEEAFFRLLRKMDVDTNWTQDQTVRAIITNPLYMTLGTLAGGRVD